MSLGKRFQCLSMKARLAEARLGPDLVFSIKGGGFTATLDVLIFSFSMGAQPLS
jgi:hypothetical protein